MPLAYEGNQPYIFISYSHRDTKFVHHAIEQLQLAGYRVWFDGGIEAGSEWPEYIASHLRNCQCVLTFISETFVDSQNCRRELNFAQNLKKPLLNIYISDVELTDGMLMQLGLSQAMYRQNYADDAGFMEVLIRAKILQDCRDVPTAAEPKVIKKPAQSAVNTVKSDKPVEKAAPEKAGGKTKMSGKAKLVCWIVALVELSYCILCPWILERLTGMTDNGWKLFGMMLIPHTVVAIVNTVIIKLSSKRIPTADYNTLSMIALACWAVSTVLAVVIGLFYIQFPINGLLRLLISLGLNLIPAVIAGGCYFGIMAFTDIKS